jgi:hypothetical protein
LSLIWQERAVEGSLPKKMTRMRAVNHQFLTRIRPEFESWGLSQHPNPGEAFGVSEHGYHYGFADLTDRSNVRLVGFGIIQPDASLWIRGYKAGPLRSDENELMILSDNVKDLFVLKRPWSILRPAWFSLPRKSIKPPMEQAAELIDAVASRLPKLKNYLYS